MTGKAGRTKRIKRVNTSLYDQDMVDALDRLVKESRRTTAAEWLSQDVLRPILLEEIERHERSKK